MSVAMFSFALFLASRVADSTSVESTCLGNDNSANEFDEVSLLSIRSKVVHRLMPRPVVPAAEASAAVEAPAGEAPGAIEEPPPPSEEVPAATAAAAEAAVTEGGLEWKTLSQAKIKIVAAKKRVKEEFVGDAFLQRLLNQVTLTGIQRSTFNPESFKAFSRSEDAEAYWAQREQNGPECLLPKQAVFVLGPSGAGKTASAATVFSDLDLELPAMSYDGADCRDVSDWWKLYAQSGRFLVKGFYEKVYSPVVKDLHLKQINAWAEQYEPCTLVRPDTAILDFAGRLPGKNGVKSPHSVTSMAGAFARRGYQAKFVAVLAPYQQVVERGEARAATEGKEFSAVNYAKALLAVPKLIQTFGIEHFTFVENTMVGGEPLRRLTLEEWMVKSRQQRDIAQEARLSQ